MDRQLFSIQETADRWGVSHFTIRRLIDAGDIHSVTIAARRMVPRTELERCELMGTVGKPRPRGKKLARKGVAAL